MVGDNPTPATSDPADRDNPCTVAAGPSRGPAAAATIAAVDYRSVSFWLGDSGDDLTPRPALDGSTDADVAILGAGLTGLWTAFYLRRRDPSLRIVIVEREIAGFGASGRNGAWCAPDFNISMGRLAPASTARTPRGRCSRRRTTRSTRWAARRPRRASTRASTRAAEMLVARGPQGVPSARGRARGVRAVRVRRPLPAARRRGAPPTGSGSRGPCAAL